MQNMSLVDAKTNAILVRDVRVAESTWEKTRGLLARPEQECGQGFWIGGCRCIHMVGMRYAIDVVFINAAGMIVKIDHELKPWRLAFCLIARNVLELPCGGAEAVGIAVGQGVRLVPFFQKDNA